MISELTEDQISGIVERFKAGGCRSRIEGDTRWMIVDERLEACHHTWESPPGTSNFKSAGVVRFDGEVLSFHSNVSERLCSRLKDALFSENIRKKNKHEAFFEYLNTPDC